MIDDTECLRCKEPFAFEVLCDSCDRDTTKRVERLFNRASEAQEKGRRLAKEPQDDINLDLVLKCGREWEGYLELAKIQNQIFFNPDYIYKEIENTQKMDVLKYDRIGRDE
jgi:hypothetical protein